MATVLILCVLVAGEVQAPSFIAANEELRGFLLEASNNSPALKARHQAWLAALERVPQVTALDDPMFTYGQFLLSDVSRFKLKAAQKFPWFGTLRTRGKKAAAEADAALARLYGERDRVFAAVKQAYAEYAFLDASLRVTDGQAELLAFMEDVVRSKLALGMAGDDDLLRVAIEKTRVEDRRAQLTQMRPVAVASLNEALGSDVVEERPWPQEAALPPPIPPVSDVLAQVRAANPDLTVFDHLVESRQEQVELARKKGYPDFTVGLEYVSLSKPRQRRPDRPYPSSLNAANRVLNTAMGATPFSLANAAIDTYSLATAIEPMAYSDGGEDNLMVSLSVNVPIWRKRVRAGVQEARLREEATHHEKRRTALALEAAARRAMFGVQDAARRHRLFQDALMPQAQQTYESLQTAYAADLPGSSFLDLLDSLQTLLEFQLEQVRAVRDWHLAAAELERLMGGPWTDEAAKAAAADASSRSTAAAEPAE